MDKERTWLLNEKYDGIETEGFQKDCERLTQGEPLAYIIGHIPFCNCHIDLEYKPLIPRVETEYWVHKFITKELTDKQAEILDLFAGSGCVGIAVLKNSQASVDFGEIKKENVRQIEKNLDINNIKNSLYQIFESDVFESIPDKKYDYILANPPYIAKDRMDTVDESVFRHEDPGALFADNDGLYFVEKLIKEGVKHLKPGGKIYVEYDPWQTEKIKELLKENSVSDFEIQEDQYGKERVLVFGYQAKI